MSRKAATSFSTPTMATWIRGRVVTRRALPSLVTITRLPVSATAMLAPEMPMSASRNLGRSLARANFTSLGMSGVCPGSTSWLNTSVTSSLVMWMAGMTMWDGVWPASWMIHSPRSVSATSMPPLPQVRVEVDLLRGHGLGLDDPGHAPGLGQVQDVLPHLGRVAGAEHLGAPGLGLALEGLRQLIQAAGGVGLDLPDARPHSLEVDALVGLGPASR